MSDLVRGTIWVWALDRVDQAMPPELIRMDVDGNYAAQFTPDEPGDWSYYGDFDSMTARIQGPSGQTVIAPILPQQHVAETSKLLEVIEMLLVEDPWVTMDDFSCFFCGSWKTNRDQTTYLHEPECGWIQAMDHLNRPHPHHVAWRP